MEHVRHFDGAPGLDRVQEYLAKNPTPFATSELYSSQHDAKILDLDQRKSIFRLLNDDEIFCLVEETVNMLNETDEHYFYLLHKDDITEVKYRPGDFFKRHKDYLSTTSNLIEEFTLLLCVTPHHLVQNGVEGGATVIFPYKSEEGVPFDTTTPGAGLVLRKDLDHAGALLKSGEKHILTANLWATRKEKSSQVLLVTFPEMKNRPKTGSIEQDKTNSIEQVASPHSSYALPVDCLRGTMLDAHVRFINQGYIQQGQDIPPIVTYECRDYDFESFGTVVKILQRSYVDEHRILRDAACLDYFGPFQTENLLVNLSTEVRYEPVPKKIHSSETCLDDKTDGNLDVIVCENESRTKVVCNVARKLGEPYVPFKMLFVEGILQSFDSDGGHTGYSSIPVTPVACLLGDYNNIFALRKVNARIYRMYARSLKEFHQEHNYWGFLSPEQKQFMSAVSPGQKLTGNYLGYGIFDRDMKDHFLEEGAGFSLKFGYGSDSVHSKVLEFVFGHPYDDLEQQIEELEFLPGTIAKTEPQQQSTLFHWDNKGRVGFTAEEAEATSDVIASMQLDERVKACIQEKRFELPQESKEMKAFFCNDQVYGNCNILWITGAVRLDESSLHHIKPKEIQVEFDAWPSENKKLDAKTYRKAGWHYYHEEYDEYSWQNLDEPRHGRRWA